MLKPRTKPFLLASALALSGCQFLPAVQQCEPPQAPPAWMMQKREPNLTQRLVNELSPPPTTGTMPSAP